MPEPATAVLRNLTEALDYVRSLVESSDVEGARAYVRLLEAQWPNEPRVRQWAKVLAPPRVIGRRAGTGSSLAPEKPWIRAHAREYPGCWIALDGDRLLAADPDLDVVIEAVQSDGAVDPLLHFQPDPEEWR